MDPDETARMRRLIWSMLVAIALRMTHCDTKENLLPKRSRRIKYRPEQIEALERAFEVNHYPDSLQQEQLGIDLDITLDRISIWFQNRRSKFKRQRQADHMTWMRKQIFRSRDDENGGNLLGTPKLPTLSSACHVLSPLESRVPRDDNMTDTVSGSPSPYMWNGNKAECMRHLSHNENYRQHQPISCHYVPNHSSATSCLSTPTRPPVPDYTTSAMMQQTHAPLYDMFHMFPPTFTSFYVPSMHAIAQSQVSRSSLDEGEISSYTVYPQNQSPKYDLNTHIKQEDHNTSDAYKETDSPSSSSAVNKLKFGWLDSDSDSSPPKDKTLECLAQWC